MNKVTASYTQLNSHFDDLLKKSDLYQAYEIGYVSGLFSLYQYIATTDSIESADKCFDCMLKENNNIGMYLREIVGAFKKEDDDK